MQTLGLCGFLALFSLLAWVFTGSREYLVPFGVAMAAAGLVGAVELWAWYRGDSR